MEKSSENKKRSIAEFLSHFLIGYVDEDNFELRVLITSSLIAFWGSFIGLVWNFFLGLPLIVNLIISFFMFIYMGIYYTARFKNQYRPVLFVSTSLLLLIPLYLFNGGLNGSIPILFVVFIVVFVTLSDSKNQIPILIITFFTLTALIIVEHFSLSDFIKQYVILEKRESDLAFGYLASMVICFVIINYFKKTITNKNIQLHRLNKSKDLVFNIIAHDLRGPFTSIIGLTSLMSNKSGNLSMKEFQEYSKLLNEKSEHTLEFLESLLEWGKIQMNKINLEPEPINLSNFFDELRKHFLEKHSNINVEIKIEVSNDIYVNANKAVLKTILRNLLSNALKFTHAGGEIVLTVEKFDSKKYLIIVKDSGIGMNDLIKNNLFNAEVNTNRKGVNGEATRGLGLIITRELIEKQGGTLFVESKVNYGSSFKFTVSKSN